MKKKIMNWLNNLLGFTKAGKVAQETSKELREVGNILNNNRGLINDR